jgi:hypothetical protein
LAGKSPEIPGGSMRFRRNHRNRYGKLWGKPGKIVGLMENMEEFCSGEIY